MCPSQEPLQYEGVSNDATAFEGPECKIQLQFGPEVSVTLYDGEQGETISFDSEADFYASFTKNATFDFVTRRIRCLQPSCACRRVGVAVCACDQPFAFPAGLHYLPSWGKSSMLMPQSWQPCPQMTRRGRDYRLSLYLQLWLAVSPTIPSACWPTSSLMGILCTRVLAPAACSRLCKGSVFRVILVMRDQTRAYCAIGTYVSPFTYTTMRASWLMPMPVLWPCRRS